MSRSLRIVLPLALLVVLSGSPGLYAQAGRGAGQGAALGGVLGLVLGGDLWSAAEGAAAGAAVGAVSGAISESNRKRDAERAELERLRSMELQLLEQERSRSAEAERRRLEEERLRLAQERVMLEQQMAAERAAAGVEPSTPDDEQAWIDAIGEDNYNSAVALLECQHDRAALLAQAGGTSPNHDYRLAGKWMEALIAVDRRDMDNANLLFEELVIVDNDIDSVQQASIEADKAILEFRSIRRDEGITCQP